MESFTKYIIYIFKDHILQKTLKFKIEKLSNWLGLILTIGCWLLRIILKKFSKCFVVSKPLNTSRKIIQNKKAYGLRIKYEEQLQYL